MRASRMLRRLAEVRHVPRYVEDQRLSEPKPRRVLAGYDVVPRGASTTHQAFDEALHDRHAYLEERRQRALDIITALGYDPEDVPEDGVSISGARVEVTTLWRDNAGQIVRGPDQRPFTTVTAHTLPNAFRTDTTGPR